MIYDFYFVVTFRNERGDVFVDTYSVEIGDTEDQFNAYKSACECALDYFYKYHEDSVPLTIVGTLVNA